MDSRAKVSFKLGAKRKFTTQASEAPKPTDDPDPAPSEKEDEDVTHVEQASKSWLQGLKGQRTPGVKGGEGTTTIAKVTATPIQTQSIKISSAQPVPVRHLHNPPFSSTPSMAEPPAKRAKRTDSSAMWERNSSRPTESDHRYSVAKEISNGRDRRNDRDRYHGREDGRRRSRSRDREEKRRDRIRLREMDSGRYRDGDRGSERDRRDRERTTSRERHRTRRDDPPPRRSDRHRTRSRSPPRNDKPPTRTRSPPQGPSSKSAPSKPQPQHPTTKPPPLQSIPPTEPRKPDRPHSDRNPQTSMADTPPPATNGNKSPATNPISTTAMDVDSDPETAQMRKMMGFATFKTTKNTKVPGNDVWAIRKEKKTEYRQYMNRVGGFNRPLSPSR